MVAGSSCRIRPFDGSMADAQGILAVEHATFDESPYDAVEVQAMLAAGPQHAWVAVQGSRVTGFVIAFLTNSLRGPCWEIDLLAVHPDWQGRHLGGRLIETAAVFGARLARQVRAVTADDNSASTASFVRAGFRAVPGRCNLLIWRPSEEAHGGGLRPLANADGVLVREQMRTGSLLLLAQQGNRPAGQAELVEVQTLLYHGVWIESLKSAVPAVREALVEHAMQHARRTGLDEVGAVVPDDNLPLQKVLLAAGFRSLGAFRWLTADLPLAMRPAGSRV